VRPRGLPPLQSLKPAEFLGIFVRATLLLLFAQSTRTKIAVTRPGLRQNKHSAASCSSKRKAVADTAFHHVRRRIIYQTAGGKAIGFIARSVGWKERLRTVSYS
jgi:hypothetical protein